MRIGRPKPKRRFLKAVLMLAVVGGLVWGILAAWEDLHGESPNAAAEATVSSATLDQAEGLLREHKAPEVVQLLTPLVERGHDRSAGPRVLMLLARAEKQVGRPADALQYLRHAAEDYPASPDQPRAAIAYGRQLEDLGKTEQARAVYERVRANAPPGVRAPALTGLGRLDEAQHDPLAARGLYREAVKETLWDSPAWREAVAALGRVDVALIFSTQPTPGSRVYVIQKGDSLTSIGNKLNTTQGLLMRANDINEFVRLDIGERLKYTPKDFRIVIERSKCRLFLLDHDGIFKVYPVGLGMPGHETTLGSYTIGNKQKDPVWHKPGVGPIPAGDPRNELGTRWMPLVPTKEGLPTDLGIHGTIAPETIGKYSSHGCARMRRADIEELYDLVVRGTPVDIVGTYKPGAKS